MPKLKTRSCSQSSASEVGSEAACESVRAVFCVGGEGVVRIVVREASRGDWRRRMWEEGLEEMKACRVCAMVGGEGISYAAKSRNTRHDSPAETATKRGTLSRLLASAFLAFLPFLPPSTSIPPS